MPILETPVTTHHLPHPPAMPRKTSKGAILGIAAAALAATALINTYQARRAERRNPPTGRFVDVDGVRLHYIEKGEGPPVVLIHGNIVNAMDFVHSGLFDLVAQRHRVIAFDRPGMGHSDRPHGRSWMPAAQADLLRRACERLGIERPVVVGHSWGAMVAIAMGLDHPQALSGLVLMGGYYYPTARADIALTVPSVIPVLGDVLRYTVTPLTGSALLPALIKGMFAPNPVPDRFTQSFAPALALRPWQIRAMAQDGAAMIAAAAAVQHRYHELSMPVAIMAGAEDLVIDVQRQSGRLHEEVRDSSLRLLPHLGHLFYYEAPQQALMAIDTVWERAGAAAATGSAPPKAASV